MDQPNVIVRAFASSTFSDLRVTREFFQTQPGNQLPQQCYHRRGQFQPTDRIGAGSDGVLPVLTPRMFSQIWRAR